MRELKTISVNKTLNGSVYVKYVNNITGEVKERSGEWRPNRSGYGEYFRFYGVVDEHDRPLPINAEYPALEVGGIGDIVKLD